MPFYKLFSLILLFCCITTTGIAQSDTSITKQIDLFDILGKISPHLDIERNDSIPLKPGNLHLSVLPVIAYSLQTGMVGGITGNVAFYTGIGNKANISNIVSTLAYTQQHQVIIIIQPIIWTKENKYNITGDIIYLKYPQETFGLGGYSTLANADHIDYSYLRFYQTAYKQIREDFFTGIGYSLDYHWKIKESFISQESTYDFRNYGFTNQSISSGITLNALFDNRRNSINPQKGFYGNIIYRFNNSSLGSDQNWTSLLIDLRKYFHFLSSKNTLAFWSYNWLTLSGNPPYLDLPSTGWDNYGNTGRGYIQGRFRGKKMIYLETEYRFRITRNGLLGGVVFLNTQSFSEWPSNTFRTIRPGYGTGIRIKVNKHSNTNIALDYGFGIGGSRGLFVNLCEMF